jgi:hypothetical protein
MINLIKIIITFSLSLPSTFSLNPGKLPSGKDRAYNFNHYNPENDIKQITPMEASFVSRHWLNNILQPKQISQEDVLIVEKINLLEQFIQIQFTTHKENGIEYFAWKPQGFTTDILFLIVIKTSETTDTLKMLINSPFWEPRQISNDCLLESLTKYSNSLDKTLNIDDFLKDHIRYKLIWGDYKVEMF